MDKKQSNLSQLMDYAGRHRYLTYVSLLLSAVSAVHLQHIHHSAQRKLPAVLSSERCREILMNLRMQQRQNSRLLSV